MGFNLDRFKAAVEFGRNSANPAINDCSEMMSAAADEIERLRAFQAAGDQWHAAYTELRAALKVAEDDDNLIGRNG